MREADLLLHVVDISHPKYEEQMATVNKTLQEITAFDKPVITVFNKIDVYEEKTFDEWLDGGNKTGNFTSIRRKMAAGNR